MTFLIHNFENHFHFHFNGEFELIELENFVIRSHTRTSMEWAPAGANTKYTLFDRTIICPFGIHISIARIEYSEMLPEKNREGNA